ncbi:xylulokinase [Rubritalea marina]|uniref:xylulokinase n=1 Tax=Rubritalea marina TaxID=361055 RepID=UPI000368D0D6|nr:FGGY family carbohydrate kinase [Rubritalea marina]
MKNIIVAIDLGTQSSRAAVVRQGGEILGISQTLHELEAPHEGWAQQRPDQWWDEICQCIQQVMRDTGVLPEQLAAVSCCGQMAGPVGIDTEGELTTPWAQLWCDKRCAEQVEALHAAHDEKALMQLAANTANPAWTGLKVRWEKDHRPESYERTRWYLVPKDYINFKLTGVAAADHTEASLSFLYDANTQDYSQPLADAVGVDLAKFAPLHNAYDVIGSVTAEAQKLTGIPTGTPVVAGAGDFPASMLGFGIIGEDVVADVTGTSSLLAGHSPEPVIDPAIQNMRHIVDGWVPFTILDCGGMSMKWCKELMSSVNGECSYEQLIAAAEDVEAASDGLFFFPYMRGERRSENVNSKGGYFGISTEHNAAHFTRSVMEGVAFAMGKDAGIFRSCGLELTTIMSVGGGTRNQLWNNIKAAVLNLPMQISPEPEAGIKGCALLGEKAAGFIDDVGAEAIARRQASNTVTPDPEWVETYAKGQKEYNRIYDHMLGFWS